MSDYWDESVQLLGLGSISHLSDHGTRRKKRPFGFVANESKVKPRPKPRQRPARKGRK